MVTRPAVDVPAKGDHHETPNSTIWTLNARDSVYLRVLQDVLHLEAGGTHRLIQTLLASVEQSLARKKVFYQDLRRPLCPHEDVGEACFFFDSERIGEYWYGRRVGELMLLALEREHSTSLLWGDIGASSPYLWLAALDDAKLVAPLPSHPNYVMAVYVNNVTPARRERMHASLLGQDGYLGYADTTYASLLKSMLAMTLTPCYVKMGDVFIAQCPDDASDDTNENSPGWPLEGHGYRCVSIGSAVYSTFLSYKIERLSEGDPNLDDDVSFALTAIEPDPLRLAECRLLIEPEKFNLFLRKTRIESLRNAGIDHLDRGELEQLVQRQLTMNYVYELKLRDGQAFFNTIVEVPNAPAGRRHRIRVNLEYLPRASTVRLVTLI